MKNQVMKSKPLLFIILALFICHFSNAQILKKMKKVKESIGESISLDKLSSDPVTTSFKDVDTTKYLPNDFGDDATYKNLNTQPYDWENGFYLVPGFYEGHFKSFCIKAGTYTPTEGNGRFYAALKGPQADIVAAIIEGFQKNSSISQKEVQLLLWAIISKTDFQKMKGEIKATALRLLTPKQIARLSKGSLEKYASGEIYKLVKKNKTVRYVLEAENNLRQLYYQGISSYEEYEKIAMRAGIEPVTNEYNMGRWTKHPNGFFIRYKLKSYRETITQIYVPEDNIEAYQPIKGKGPFTSGNFTLVTGKYYKSRNSIATPPNPNAQRIIQTDIEVNGGGPSGGSGSQGSGGGQGGGDQGGGDQGGGDQGGGDQGGGDQGGGDQGGGDQGGGDQGGGDQGGGDQGGGNQEGGDQGGGDQEGGQGGSGGSGGGVPNGAQDTNAFPCEEVVNTVADKTIKKEMVLQNLPGVIVCIFKGDSIIHMKAYGKMGPGKPLTLDTQIQWASISKSVTAVAAMQAVEAGKLKLSDKALDLLSYWPSSVEVKDVDNKKITDNRLGGITLRHLLNNTSGIQHYGRGNKDSTFTYLNDRKVPFVHNYNDYTPLFNGLFNAKKAVEQFNQSVLDFEPDSSYLYSSYGFVLAGAMVDKQVSMGYEQWVLKHIKSKLGLKTFSKTTSGSDVFGYEMFEDGILKSHRVENHNCVLPAGGWKSTICDLATYARAISDGELLNDGEALWRKENMHMFDESESRGYGFGINRAGTGNNLRVSHGGTNNYSRAFMMVFPSDTTGVVVLAPHRNANVERLTRQLIVRMGLRDSLFKKEATPLDICHNGMGSSNDRFLGVWRKTGKEQLIRTGLSLEEFKIEMNNLNRYGYHLDTFDIHFTDDEESIYDGIFKKEKKVQVLVTGKSLSQLTQLIDTYRAQGMEIVAIAYGKGSGGASTEFNVTYNALFQKDAPKSFLFKKSNLTNITNFINETQSQNLKLMEIEISPAGNYDAFLCLFVKGSPNNFFIKSPSEFQDNLSNGAYNGSIKDMELYIDSTDNNWKIASIWEPTDKEQKTTITANSTWVDFCTMMNLHENYSSKGYELIVWDRVYIRP